MAVVPRPAWWATTSAATGCTMDNVSATQLHHLLRILESERREAEHSGLIDCEDYRRDLEEETEECLTAFIGAAVTEIATLRAELFGRQVG